MVRGEFDVIDRDSNVFIFSYVYDNGLGSCASAFFLSTLRVIELYNQTFVINSVCLVHHPMATVLTHSIL